MYNTTDLINKAISQAKTRKRFVEGLAKSEEDLGKKILLRTLTNWVSRDISYYERILETITAEVEESIDFFIYDKIASLIYQYGEKMKIVPTFKNKIQILDFAIEMDQGLKALYVDIQGRLIQSEADNQSMTYKVLSQMIEYKIRNIEEMRKFKDSTK